MSYFMLNPEQLLPLIVLTSSGVTKSTSWDLDTAQNGAGSLVVSLAAVTCANQGLPDYWVDLEISGLTFPENDPEKATIYQMHADALACVQTFTPERLTSAFGFDSPAAVIGIINIDSSFAFDQATNIFRINFRLATTDTYLTYYEKPLPVYQCVDTGTGVQYLRFENATPCAVQRLTTVNTTAPDGGNRSTITREVAYGDWADRENLTYYPVNQPVPVQTNT